MDGCRLTWVLMAEEDFLEWGKGGYVGRTAGVKGRPEARAQRLRNHKLSRGVGTLGVWWELRGESPKMNRKTQAVKDVTCHTEGAGIYSMGQ